MSRIAGSSLIEGALVDWTIEQPVRLPQLPVELLSREQVAVELQRVSAQKAMLAAYEAELVLALADASPDGDDPAPGTPGARGSWGARSQPAGVSEFFAAELSMVLNCGRGTASHLVARAWTWRENLPGTWGALAAGVLDEPRAKVMAEVLEQAEPGVARRVEAELLPEAGDLSLRRLRGRASALLLRHDATAADERRQEAELATDVRVYPSPRDGMSTVAAELPIEEAAAVHDTVDRLARMLKADGDTRPIGQLRSQVFSDLIRRPWDDSRPSTTAHLQIVTALAALEGTSTEAGEVSGLAITAAHLRELLRRLDAPGVQAPEGGSVTVALTDDDGGLLATARLERLRRLARRGCPTHPGDAGEGADGCGCALLGRPAAVDRYTPSAAQQTFVRTRDRTCRFPNCGQRVGWADADHVVPHSCGGGTDCANLCCLCRSHHRLKTFARGWHFEMTTDGVLTVTTPSGVTRTTRPPGLRPPGTGADPPRSTSPSRQPDGAAGRGDGRSPGWQPPTGAGGPSAPSLGDDPPPF